MDSVQLFTNCCWRAQWDCWDKAKSLRTVLVPMCRDILCEQASRERGFKFLYYIISSRMMRRMKKRERKGKTHLASREKGSKVLY
jgi:hypothetical protein